MYGFTVLILLALLIVGGALLFKADAVRPGLSRAAGQFFSLVPRMVVAVVAAGFVVQLLPVDLIGSLFGDEAGFVGIIAGAAAGIIVPSGPVVAFAIAAAFAKSGASLPALVAFVTGWSVFAVHRVLIFEIPLLGTSFVRVRLLAVSVLPVVAGMLTLLADKVGLIMQR